MSKIHIKGFRGAVPRSSERLQPQNFANQARNIKISSGNIVPMLGPLWMGDTGTAASESLWRYRVTVNGVDHDHWFTFAKDTDTVTAPTKDNNNGLVYWTSKGDEPRMSTLAAAINGSGVYPAAWFALGTPNPLTAPTVTVTGGSGTLAPRYYICTYVTPLGEESGPCPASAIVTGYPNGTWTLGALPTAPPNTGTVTAITLLGTGHVRLTLNTVFGIVVGTGVSINGVVQSVSGTLEAGINGEHVVTGVNLTSNYIDVYLPNQNTPTTPTGTWGRSAPFNTAGMTKRLYRSAGTGAAPKFVTAIAVALTTYVDAVVDTALGAECESLSNLPPPGDLTCLISLPNGVIAGISGNELCFSDPYKPYSWPDNNRYSFSGRGVALAKAASSVMVLTDTLPILYTGGDPAAMSPTTMETYAPCVAKRGVVQIGGGAIYPSHDGLWLASPSGVNLLSRSLYRLSDWSALAPTTFVAVYHDGQYLTVHTPVGQTEKTILVLDIAELDSAVTVDDYADALYRNDYDGKLYVTKGARVFAWDASDSQRYVTEWTSVEMQMSVPRNFSHAQVHADFGTFVAPDESILLANNALLDAATDTVGGDMLSDEFLSLELNSSNIGQYAATTPRTVQFVLYSGDTPVYSRLVTSSRPFRLPAGYKVETLRIGINTSVEVYSVTIAESTEELAVASGSA